MSYEKIRQKLIEFTKAPIQVITGEVTAVDEDAQTVDVKPPGRAEYLDVRLKAAIDDQEDGFYEIPEVGSSVLIGLIGNDKDTAFVLKCSKVAKIKAKIGDTTLEINEGGITINGGELGGLIKVEELKTQLDKNSQAIQALLDLFTNWTPVAQDGGAALKGLSASLAGKQVGDFGDIENDKVKH